MKIYTGGGDRGKTSLFSGERVNKSDLRVEAYGDVDELASLLGALGAWLAVTPGSPASSELPSISQEHAKGLEAAIDRMEQELPALKDFILPGGHVSAAWAHVARAVCRRAERHVVRLSATSRCNNVPESPFRLSFCARPLLQQDPGADG